MSRCEELKEVFGDHFICSQCDKGLSLGDILILNNRPHKIVHVYRRSINNIPLYVLDYMPADASIAEKAYEKLLSSERGNYNVYPFNIVGNKVYNEHDHEQLTWLIEFLDTGGIMARTSNSEDIEFNSIEKLRSHIQGKLKTENDRDRYAIWLVCHTESTKQDAFCWTRS